MSTESEKLKSVKFLKTPGNRRHTFSIPSKNYSVMKLSVYFRVASATNIEAKVPHFFCSFSLCWKTLAWKHKSCSHVLNT